MPAKHILFPAADSLNRVREPGKFTSPLMLHDLGAGPQSTAVEIVSDVMESCRNEGSIVLFMDRRQPREILSGLM
jgi:homoserine dehydrogenase